MGCVTTTDDDHNNKAKSMQDNNRTIPTSQTASVFVTKSSILIKNPHHNQIINTLMCKIAQRLKVNSIISVNLIFRASDHKFKASEFRNCCHEQKNTVLIACTIDNKYFGAFTPCEWKKDEILTYEHDENGSSFLFNVSKQKVIFYKIKQQEKKFAILNDSDSGPVFGKGHDINIVDECDKNVSWSNLGKSYGSEFKYGSSKSNSQLCGCQKYKLRQYQIWKIQTKQSIQK